MSKRIQFTENTAGLFMKKDSPYMAVKPMSFFYPRSTVLQRDRDLNMQRGHLARLNGMHRVEKITAVNHHMGILQIGGEGQAKEIRIGHKAQLASGRYLRKKTSSLMVALSKPQPHLLRKTLQQYPRHHSFALQNLHVMKIDSILFQNKSLLLCSASFCFIIRCTPLFVKLGCFHHICRLDGVSWTDL